MKTAVNYSQWFVEEVARCAREGWKALGATNCAEHYLYYKALSLVIAQDKPSPEYQLATPERVPGNLTIDGLTAWVHRRSTRLPILPTEDP